jgi:hypothetical protein
MSKSGDKLHSDGLLYEEQIANFIETKNIVIIHKRKTFAFREMPQDNNEHHLVNNRMLKIFTSLHE